MQKKTPLNSASVSPRQLVVLLVCAAACLILTGTTPAFFSSAASANASQRTLTFAERVAYQRAIEDVYWRHRIWPKERPDPKPSLEAVMTQSQLEKKVADYLRKSQALEDYWQRPITSEQLQAEMDRMAKHTKQPEVLQELFNALGNDPFVIAECLARPALANRLLASSYAYDQRIHRELRRKAETELAAYPTVEQMKQLSGDYRETELIRSDTGHAQTRSVPGHGVQLNSREWDETVQNLAAMCGDYSVEACASARSMLGEGRSPGKAATTAQIKTGVLSSLQEDETRFYATAVLGKTDHHLKLVTISWPKQPVGRWLAEAENQIPVTHEAVTAGYRLPKTSDGAGCIDDTWTGTSGPPDPRGGPVAVWTGSEMIVWGGGTSFTVFNTGGRYNPATDSWTATSNTSAPSARGYHTGVWSGTEMIVWGGLGSQGELNTGGRYNPDTDSWTATSTTDAPTARSSHTAVWTGTEMIVWGGYDGVTELNTGGRYNPGTDSWISTGISNAPIGRYGHTAVWTGSEMIVWGGVDESLNRSNTGGRYNPGTDSWTATSLTNVPDGRQFHSAVWTETEMIVWGGDAGGVPFNTGGRYDPGSDSWTATSTTNAPDGRSSHTAVWSGSEMIVWGGFIGGGDTNTGGKYNPATDSWTATSTTNAPDARDGHAAVWSGNEMIVWGGFGGNSFFESGGRYNPTGDSWVPTGKTPARRARHAAVWTGSEMVVWGGSLQAGFTDTGAKYDPITDSWTTTNTANAPTARFLHTAVWTGTEMIVWGGFDVNGSDVNTGGRYNPVTDSWVATSTTSAPVGRESHTAVWTGSAMIVWGGFDGTNDLNTGGKYNPGTNSWTATATVAAPSARSSHGAVWSGTGNEMIVWGGIGDTGYVNTGGIYNPNTDSWTATTVANAPSARTVHGPLWTGSEMLVWGGYFTDGLNDYYLNTGGRYDPGTDSWTATSTVNAPDGRTTHTAVWTGNEMIVWGGQAGFIGYYFNTGGRYDPGTDSWTATSTNNVPDGRYRHTAVWTGNEMIVWGGILYSNGYTASGARYCAQSGPTPSPTPTPTPCTGRCSPTPRPRPTPVPRP